MAEEIKEPVVVGNKEEIVEDPIAQRDAKIAALEAERDNYKNVALKRLGKLPGDKEFLEGEGKTQLTTEEIVKNTLLDRELEIARTEREQDIKKVLKENSELKLALKNRPQGALGGDSGSSGVEVKDNVFSPQQIEALKQRALRLKADPEKFIENAKKNLLARK
jgi:hypothetical protein